MNLSQAWMAALKEILSEGSTVSPRGNLTKEILQRTMIVDMRKPVLTSPARKLSYQFMAAEAFWILSGDNRVETISPYNQRIKDFSDDGIFFFGAYGPRIKSQLSYVIDKLVEDQSSRQAGLTIWRENPPPTKDVPCTVSIFFSIRESLLNVHVFMRSSDVWLGVPYDVFNFSMLGHMVCCLLSLRDIFVSPGEVFLTAASSHLYERDWVNARKCLSTWFPDQNPTPQYFSTGLPDRMLGDLQLLRESKPGDYLRWWEI